MTTNPTGSITGREPQLTNHAEKRGERRLSLRRLATMLSVLPPNAVSLDAAREMLRNEEFYVRYNAAKMLSRRADREARLIMQDVLREGDAPARASVARHLYGFSWYSAEPMIREALKDADSRVREAAIYALCDLRELNAYHLLREVLRDANDDMRMAAAWGLRECQDPAAVPALEMVLLADDPDVRVKGLEALGANDTPEALPVVRNAMNDPEPDVKYAATLSLLELAGEAWLVELSSIIGRTSGATRHQVLRGLFHATNYLKIDMGRTSAAEVMIDALESALLDDMPEVRMAVAYPLAWMRHERSPMLLRKAYMLEEDPHVKAQMMRIGASLSPDVGDELLRDGLNSPIEHVRTVAQQIMEDRARIIVRK
ncbi:MAG: HEAT repeat domain-containing protein [bacterium]|nr:HEAT repeat domain-containing protein [bacterium]